MSLLYQVVDLYNYFDYDLSDTLSRDSRFSSIPLMIVTIILSSKFILDWGPSFMAKRQPYNLKKIIILYNISQIFLSLYLFLNFSGLFTSGYYDFFCQPPIYEDTPMEKKVNFLAKLYYLVKIYDLLDTTFFILTKKMTHVSFLHIYHHISMIFFGFVFFKYMRAGTSVMGFMLNSGVHAIMYFYYMLAAIDKKMVLRWKKFITQIQIIQFVIMVVFLTMLSFNACEYPKIFPRMMLAQVILLLMLFMKFYRSTYMKMKHK